MGKAKIVIAEVRSVWRQSGLRGVLRRYGWRVLAIFFFYYLIRDLIFYIFLPYIFAKGLLF